MKIHRLKEPERLSAIAKEYSLAPEAVAAANGLSPKARLPRGYEVLIITPSRTHTVKRRESLADIGKRYRIEGRQLLRLNPSLEGEDGIYEGQLLAVGSTGERYGMTDTNGYFYKGASPSRLTEVLPYLGYLTVSAAVYRDRAVEVTFKTDDIVKAARLAGVTPMLRVYIGDGIDDLDARSLGGSCALLAIAGGFAGVTVSSIGGSSLSNEEKDKFILELRRVMMENDLLLFAEGDAQYYTGYTEYADAGVITYDKLHLSPIPSFNDGERAALTRIADEQENGNIFIVLPAFGIADGRYIDKSEAVRMAARSDEVEHNDDSLVASVRYGKRGGELRFESLENTFKRMECASEKGFLGFALDIARVTAAELSLLSWMFKIVEKPVIGSKTKINCQGETRT